MAKILGQQIHGDRLRRLRGPAIRGRVLIAVVAGAELIAKEAKESILRGAISGPGHIPSAPGEPPNADTHELDQSIHVVAERASLRAKVVATSAAAAPNEFGTSRQAARPFMKPAGQKMRPAARQLVVAAVKDANRGV